MKKLIIMCMLTVFMLSIFPSAAVADRIDWRDKDQLEPSNPVGDENPWGELQSQDNPNPEQSNPPNTHQNGDAINALNTPSTLTRCFLQIIDNIFDAYEFIVGKNK